MRMRLFELKWGKKYREKSEGSKKLPSLVQQTLHSVKIANFPLSTELLLQRRKFIYARWISYRIERKHPIYLFRYRFFYLTFAL